jgi:CemA family
MTSIFDTEQPSLFVKIKGYVYVISDRIATTPERSLEQAYKAALKIASIEKQHFPESKIAVAATSTSSYLDSCIKADFARHLFITKIRLAEFKASTFLLGSLSTSHLAKLKSVDEVLAKYSTSSQENSSTIVPISGTENNRLATEPADYSSVAHADVESITGKTGILPRSIGRTFKQIKQDLNPNSEQEVIQKFRRSRTQTIIAVRFLVTIAIVPLLTQQLSKHFVIAPTVERVRGDNTAEVFINPEMKEEALKELQQFEEGLKFDILTASSPLSEEMKEKLVKHKATEIAKEFRAKSNDAISNVFADLIGVGSFALILLVSRKEIVVLKSFIDNLVYGISDSAKAFIIILLSDMFVGFHSPHGWEVLLEGIASHLGIAANQSMIFLFIATVPVIIDAIFKYWIFRFLSRMSPSTVATFKEMND